MFLDLFLDLFVDTLEFSDFGHELITLLFYEDLVLSDILVHLAAFLLPGLVLLEEAIDFLSVFGLFVLTLFYGSLKLSDPLYKHLLLEIFHLLLSSLFLPRA